MILPPPQLQTPVNVSLAPPAQLGDATVAVVRATRPLWGVAGIAVISAVAGYFVPRLLDRWTARELPVESYPYEGDE